ncbi:MAG TPA: U32 family peptidase C-terminal domain-containing protein [bacterium]|nr:U32 family peptidase C-terminal domain-containing protein [bacterium]HOH67482.1 U32 family peptidase C-terminal domain-containing protein [bacterium]
MSRASKKFGRRVKPELLAPAGNLEKLKYALAYGADAVYCGLPDFSLRAQTGFDFSSLAVGIKFAQQREKKVYVTVNIFAHNRQIEALPAHLKRLKKIAPDAVIVSDPGVLSLVKKIMPRVKIYLSTQANTLNYEAVKFWQQQGVARIILGREISLADIKHIRRQAPKMELEVFVHGAMCLSYSGRCYLSAWFNSRSANLGACTQPCRWQYRVYLEEPLRPAQRLPIEADSHGTYIMNSKDLRLIECLADLQRAGVTSFKIEGRTKSAYYLAIAVKAYRRAIDSGYDPKVIRQAKAELEKIDNRGYTTGFLLGTEESGRQEFDTAKVASNWQFVGEVVRVNKQEKNSKKQFIYIKVHNVLTPDDQLELVTPENCYKMKILELRDENLKIVKAAHGGTTEIFRLEVPAGWLVGERSIIRKKIVTSNE